MITSGKHLHCIHPNYDILCGPKLWYLLTKLHSTLIQKTITYIDLFSITEALNVP